VVSALTIVFHETGGCPRGWLTRISWVCSMPIETLFVQILVFLRSFLAFLSAEVVVAVDVVICVAVGVAVGVFFATASLVDLKTNSDFVGAGLGSRWMLPMMSMSSLGKAGVCLAAVGFRFGPLGVLLVAGALVGLLDGSLVGSLVGSCVWQCKVGS
jgi:hypothetical protein